MSELKLTDAGVVPMAPLFRAAARILENARCPMHYRDLTCEAIGFFGFEPGDVNWSRQIEDVREKMLLAGQYGCGYLGEPHCLAFKRHWFGTGQLEFNVDTGAVVIPGNLALAIRAVNEAIRRSPHMMQKVARADSTRLLVSRFRGLMIEAHVKDYFRRGWPTLYRAPSNEGDYTRPCDHDFRLAIGSREVKVDVYGPRLRGTWEPAKRKPSCEIHLLCAPEAGADYDGTQQGHPLGGVSWLAAQTADGIHEDLDPSTSHSPLQVIVWLNCLARGLPHAEIRARAEAA